MGWRDAPLVDAAPPAASGSWRDAPLAEAPPSRAAQIAGQVDRKAAAAGYGANQGVANLFGFPVDATTAVLNTGAAGLDLIPGVDVGRIENPIGGSDFLMDILQAPNEAISGAMEQDAYEPEGLVEKLIAGTAMGATEALVPAVGAFQRGKALTAHGVPIAQDAGSALGNLLNSTADGARINPSRFLRREGAIGASVGAGVAGGSILADDGDPNTTTMGEALWPIIGGLGGGATTAIGTGLIQGGRDLARSFGDPEGAAMDGAKEAVTRYLADVTEAPLAGNQVPDTSVPAQAVQGADRIEDIVTGYQSTLGEVLPTAGVRGAEYTRQSGPQAGRYTQRREANAAAVDETMRELAPKGDAARFRAALDDAIAKEITTRVAAAEAAQAQLDEALAQVAPRGTASSRGSDIRAALIEKRDNALAEIQQIFSAVDSNGVQVDLRPLRNRFDAVVASLPENDRVRFQPAEVETARRLAPDVDDVEGAVMEAPGSLNEATSIRSGLSSDMRSAATTDQGRRVTGMFRDEVDEYFNDLLADENSGLTPETRAALTEGQQKRFDVGRRFETPGTGIGDTLRTTDRGEFARDPSTVPGRFVQPDSGRIQDFQALLREAGDNPQVRDALANQILEDAQPFLKSPERLQKFLDERNLTLSKFPELGIKLRAAGARMEDNTAAQAASAEARKTLQPGGRSPEGRYTRAAPEDALNSMRAIVRGSDRPGEDVEALLKRAGDTPENREGLRTAFWEVLKNKAKPITASNRNPDGSDPWNFTALYRTLEDPKMSAAAERLYADNPEHLQNIKDLAGILRTADNAITAKAKGSSGTPQGIRSAGEQLGDAVTPNTETLGAYAFAYQRDQVGLLFIATRLGAVAARRFRKTAFEQQFGRILDEALLDPDYAAQLMTEYSPARMKAFVESSRARGIVLAPELVEALDASVQDDESEDDVLRRAITEDE